MKATKKEKVSKRVEQKGKRAARPKSKFAEKYNDRIISIKESDEKALKRKQAKLKEKARIAEKAKLSENKKQEKTKTERTTARKNSKTQE